MGIRKSKKAGTDAKDTAVKKADAAKAPSAAGRHEGKKKKRLNVKKFLKFLLLIIICLFAAAAVFVVGCIVTAPKIDTSDIYSLLDQNSIIYDDAGNEVDSINAGENRTNIAYSDMPENLVNAFVAIEDKTFWDHHGFNFVRVLGAIKNAIFSRGSVSGTSTITQQLARNVFMPTEKSKRSMVRKVREAWYTVKIERTLSKEQIIEAYLNTIYMGFNCNGVEAASQAYFSKSVGDLDLAQCATLAALPQAPTTYAPVVLVYPDNPDITDENTLYRSESGVYIVNEKVKARRDLVLDQMLAQGYITQEEHDAAAALSVKETLNPNYGMSGTSDANYFSEYVVDEVIADLQDQEGMTYEEAWDKVYKGGLRIYTTMDSKAQSVIETEFANDNNFPSPTNIRYDGSGNIINSSGNIIMYDYSDFFNSEGTFTFKADEIKQNSDGSLTILANKRIKLYRTEPNGTVDYSIEFPTMYIWENYKLYSISGGYINVPQEYKSADDSGNVTVSADYVTSDAGKKFFTVNSDGTVSIPKTSYTLNQRVIQPQAAMTIIENSTGQIKAMVGGRKISGRMLYNRAIHPRQPGSSIKPLGVYSAALQQSAEEAAAGKKHTFTDYKIDSQGVRGWGDYITAGSIVVDEPTTVNGQRWPKNDSGTFSGKQTLRTAMTLSLNTCAVKIQKQVGVDYAADLIEKYGITTLVRDGSVNDLNHAALALGGMTNGVTTLEMANAYTVFPNNGTRASEPICYTKVTDYQGNVILEKSNPEQVRVVNDDVAWITRNIMYDVVSRGTGMNARISGVQVGGKTGTTSNLYDIWFDGFTPSYTASLWIGNDNNLTLTSKSGYAAALWGRIMSQIPNALKGTYKEMPSTVEVHGGEYYAKGTYSKAEYYTADELKNMRTVCSETGMLATPSCTHTQKVIFDVAHGEKPPEYYCDKHNPDKKKYPTGVAEPEKEPEKSTDTDKAAETTDSGNKDSGETDSTEKDAA